MIVLSVSAEGLCTNGRDHPVIALTVPAKGLCTNSRDHPVIVPSVTAKVCEPTATVPCPLRPRSSVSGKYIREPN